MKEMNSMRLRVVFCWGFTGWRTFQHNSKSVQHPSICKRLRVGPDSSSTMAIFVWMLGYLPPSLLLWHKHSLFWVSLWPPYENDSYRINTGHETHRVVAVNLNNLFLYFFSIQCVSLQKTPPQETTAMDTAQNSAASSLPHWKKKRSAASHVNKAAIFQLADFFWMKTRMACNLYTLMTKQACVRTEASMEPTSRYIHHWTVVHISQLYQHSGKN